MADYTDADLLNAANTLYGEVADQNSEVMGMVGSSILNRLDAQRVNEFGGTIPEISQKGYYAAINGNVPYKQAVSQKFPDKNSENKYKQAYAIMSGLMKGTIDRHGAQFFFTKEEIQKLKKKGKKAFDFKQVKPTGSVGGYETFSY